MKGDNRDNHPLSRGLPPIGGGGLSCRVHRVACAGDAGLLMFEGLLVSIRNFCARESEPAFAVRSVWNTF